MNHRARLLSTSVAVATCWLVATLDTRSQEKFAGKTDKVFLATEKAIKQSKKGVDLKALSADRELLSSMFSENGKLVYETKPGTEREKFTEAVLKKADRAEALDLVAAAWYEVRVTEAKVPKGKPITFAMLTSTVDARMVRLTIRSKPKGAKVYLRANDNYVGDTQVRRWLSSGKVRVIIKLEGYDEVDEQVDVPKKNFVFAKTLRKQ